MDTILPLMIFLVLVIPLLVGVIVVIYFIRRSHKNRNEIMNRQIPVPKGGVILAEKPAQTPRKRKRVSIWVWIGVSIFVVGASLTATHLLNNPIETQPTSIVPVEYEPVTKIKEWVGAGIKTTESFTISKQPWGIVWSSYPESFQGMSIGVIQIMVYDAHNPDIPITLAANTNQRASDVSYVYKTGTFYLVINAANTSWNVQVWGK